MKIALRNFGEIISDTEFEELQVEGNFEDANNINYI